jgi:hypothetical protein
MVSRNKPKNNRNRLSFGLFRFEPKKKFDCFEDTLAGVAIVTGCSINYTLRRNLSSSHHSEFNKFLSFKIFIDENYTYKFTFSLNT